MTLDLFNAPDPEPTVRAGMTPESPEARAVLAELRKAPGAVEHVADRLGYPLTETRKAFQALEAAGQIVDNQERTETRLFKVAVVWHPAP